MPEYAWFIIPFYFSLFLIWKHELESLLVRISSISEQTLLPLCKDRNAYLQNPWNLNAINKDRFIQASCGVLSISFVPYYFNANSQLGYTRFSQSIARYSNCSIVEISMAFEQVYALVTSPLSIPGSANNSTYHIVLYTSRRADVEIASVILESPNR